MTDVPPTCRAAVVSRFGAPLEIVEVPVPDRLEAGSLLVEMTAATVCATDLKVAVGSVSATDPSAMLPLILGHEMTGTVARLADDVRTDSVGAPLAVGDRVVWTHGFCGRCRQCVVEHRPTLCTARRGYMADPYTRYPHLTGGFAEYGYVFPTSGRVRVPDNISDATASAASCAFRTVMHGFGVLGPVRPGRTVLVQGSGPLGLFATARAVACEPDRLIVVGGPADRLALARAWGATDTLDVAELTTEQERVEAVRDLTGGAGADVIVEVSGAPTAFVEGMAMLARGGAYVLMGQVRPQPQAFDASQLVLKHARVLGSLSGSVEDYVAALEYLSRHADRFDWDRMTPQRFPLADVNDALAAMTAQTTPKPVLTFAAA